MFSLVGWMVALHVHWSPKNAGERERESGESERVGGRGGEIPEDREREGEMKGRQRHSDAELYCSPMISPWLYIG